MAWLLAGAALLTLAALDGRGFLRLASLAALAAGFAFSFRVYPPSAALALFAAGAATGFAASRLTRARLASAAAFAVGAAALLFALFGPSDGLF